MKLEAVYEGISEGMDDSVGESLEEPRGAMKWHQSAGGVGVSADKHSYSAFGPWGEYHIWPKHPRGYDLKWADTKSIAGHGLWHDLGVFASPNEAKGFAKEHASAMTRIVRTVGPKVSETEENPRKPESCVPWVKVERDPVRFAKCMAIAKKVGRVDDAKRIFEITVPYLEKQDQEVILVLTLDAQLALRGVTEVARGARDRVSVSVPDIMRPAIIEGATAIALVHNHPSTQVQPSQGDIETTAAVKKACEAVKILLVDHVIVGGSDKYFSFHEHDMV